MNIRRLIPSDIEKLFRLRIKALKTVPNAFGSSSEEEVTKGPAFLESILALSGPANVVFGALNEHELVGMVGILQTGRLKTNHKATIWGMYVDEGHRGKKVGAALLDFAIDHAREQMKVVGIQLGVESSNVSAKALYHSRRFKTWGVEPKALLVDGIFYDEEHLLLLL